MQDNNVDTTEKVNLSTKVENAGQFVATFSNLAPIVGGFMGALISNIIASRQNRRLEEFLASLSDDISKLEDKINQDFLKTESFKDHRC